MGAGRSALPPTCCTVRKRVLEPGERGPGVETPTPARVSPPPSAAARSRHGLDGADGRSDGTGPAAAPRACCALRVFATGRGWSHTHRHHAGPAPRPRLHGASPDRPLPHTGGTASRTPTKLRRRRGGVVRSEWVHDVRKSALPLRGSVVRRHLVILTARPRVGRSRRASGQSVEVVSVAAAPRRRRAIGACSWDSVKVFGAGS